MTRKSVLGVIATQAIGILVFLVLLLLANALASVVPVSIVLKPVQFINANLAMLLLVWLFFFLAELFSAFTFPFNLPAPIFSAVGSVFFVTLGFAILAFIESLTGVLVFQLLRDYSTLIYAFFFLVCLLGGYMSIFGSLAAVPCRQPPYRQHEIIVKYRQAKPEEKKWGEVGEEFRLTVRDVLRAVRRAVGGKKKD